jgi:Uma2 family endonuclease
MGRMSGLDPGVKLTYDDLLLFPENDGLRHELIDGVHLVSAAPNTRHQTVLLKLAFGIQGWLENHPAGRLFVAPFDVVFSPFDVVEPDLLYMSNERAAAILNEKHAAGVPELVIEILSPATRQIDEMRKRHLYERVGVSEYWIVEPMCDEVRIHHRGANGFRAPVTCARGAVLTTPLLPGFELPLSRVF